MGSSKALEALLAENVLETRDSYRHAEEAEEPGRTVTEYHPKDSPRGEDFTHLLRRAVRERLYRKEKADEESGE